MVSLEKCKRILDEGRRGYSNEEVKVIKDILYKLAEIDYDDYTELIQHEQKGHHLHKSLN